MPDSLLRITCHGAPNLTPPSLRWPGLRELVLEGRPPPTDLALLQLEEPAKSSQALSFTTLFEGPPNMKSPPDGPAKARLPRALLQVALALREA